MQEELAKYDTDYMNEESDRAETITISIPKRFMDESGSETDEKKDHSDSDTEE